MKEVLGKELFLGDILAVASSKGIEIAVVSKIKDKSVDVIYAVSDKNGNIRKSSMVLVIHENNFGGVILSRIQDIRKEVMSV